MNGIRYNNKGFMIEIGLGQFGNPQWHDYSVQCLYNLDKQTGKYMVSMWLVRADISDRFKIDGQEIDTQPLSGEQNNIKANLCRVVEQMAYHEFFESYIDKFEYTYKCFNLGQDVSDSMETEGTDINE